MDNKIWLTKLASLDKRIKSFAEGYRQNIVLLGDDLEEVSYLLEDYLQTNKIGNLTYLRATTVNVGKRDFFKTVVLALLNSCTKRQDSFDNLLSQASFDLQNTTEFAKSCLAKTDISFFDVLEVINKFINETRLSCVLIIEDFLRLTDAFGDFYRDFSKFIILQRNCMVVLTTLHSKDAEKALSSELNLLFGNFEKIFLNEDNYIKNFTYFRQKLLPVSPSPFFMSFFLNRMGSNIIYYNLLSEIIQRNYQPEDENSSILSIIEKALYSKETYFFQKFNNRIELLKVYFKDWLSTNKLLIALGEGYLRKSELLSLGIYASSELDSRLQKLSELNYIENLGNIYKIKDPLFSFWLTAIFKLYLSPPILEPQLRMALYRKKMEEEIALFREEFYKDKIKKILQLFSSFKNDILRLGRDRYRLPSIEKLKIISYPQRDLHLIVGEGKEIVFAGIKEKNVEDSDIYDFIEKGTNVRGKGVKKIFISLDTVSHAARLIAKNNRVIIWDIGDVNRLLGIYNKPFVANSLLT